VVRTKHPPKKKRNSYERTVVKADTPTVTVTEGNEQYCAPWIVESPGGKVITSAYNDGKKVPECGRRVWQSEEENF
jgi:hypothetical protein